MFLKSSLDIYLSARGDRVGGDPSGTLQTESRRVGEWTAEPTALAQTALTKNNVSEIGGSRLDLGTLRARVSHSRSRQLGLESALGEVGNTSRWTPPRQSDDRLGERFHFHTTRLKRFRSPETLHLEASWSLPARRRRPPEDEERCWSGSFP